MEGTSSDLGSAYLVTRQSWKWDLPSLSLKYLPKALHTHELLCTHTQACAVPYTPHMYTYTNMDIP